MNTIHNNGENDTSLKEGLDKIGQAYGQLPHAEPPELLDQAILNSARRAVEKKPHWMRFGWLHGLTTAAVFVLALSLVINQREHVPVYKDAIQDNESTSLGRETAGKIQAPSAQNVDDRTEMKEKSENRQDALQSVPTSAATQSELIETTTIDRAAAPAAGIQYSTYAEDGLRAKKDSVDPDVISNEPALEEQFTDEVNLPADAQESEIPAKQSLPAAAAERATGEADSSIGTDSEIENILFEIIRLKKSGDKSWMTELELFKQKYPDYPLPEELSD